MEHQDAAVYLDAFSGEVHLEVDFSLFSQSTKFRLIIEHKVVPILLHDPCMVAGDRRVIHSDLALVPPAHPDPISRDVLNADQGGVLDLDLLQDDVLAFWEGDWHQLMHLVPSVDVLRVLIHADLAVELLEVIVSQTFDPFLLDFRLVPPLQTVEMHQRTRP